jgi:FkbM family methyltransferase
MTPAKVPWCDRFLANHFRHGRRGFISGFRIFRRLTGRGTLRMAARYGACFELSPDDYVSSVVLREGYYESEVMEALRPFFGPDAVFWDVGANFGLHAVTAKFLAPAMSVIAFEANPRMAGQIQRNAALNQVEVKLAPLALGSNSTPARLHIAAGNSGMSTLHPVEKNAYHDTITVPAARGDELVARGTYPAPTVIKVDVEGAEPDVLQGLGDLLRHPGLRAIVIEADAAFDPAKPHAVATPLQTAGFTLRRLQRNEATGHPLANFLATRA